MWCVRVVSALPGASLAKLAIRRSLVETSSDLDPRLRVRRLGEDARHLTDGVVEEPGFEAVAGSDPGHAVAHQAHGEAALTPHADAGILAFRGRGSVAMGVLYDVSLTALIVLSVGAQLAAVPVLLRLRRMGT